MRRETRACRGIRPSTRVREAPSPCPSSLDAWRWTPSCAPPPRCATDVAADPGENTIPIESALVSDARDTNPPEGIVLAAVDHPRDDDHACAITPTPSSTRRPRAG